jgi:hypothetical protein
MEELGDRHSEIMREMMKGATTFASQNTKFKNMFAAQCVVAGTSAKKTSLLKLCSDKILT